MDSRASLVELIFAKCNLVYGRDFSGRWEGMEMAEVKADWMRELGATLDKPQAVKHALTNLPDDKAPTVLQFRRLCIGAPDIFVPALHAPRTDPGIVARALGALKRPEAQHPKAWAYRLRDRDQSTLNGTQRSMWRAALSAELAAGVTAEKLAA